MIVLKKYKLVISATNITEGGPLRILKDAVLSAKKALSNKWEIIVLVNNNNLLNEDNIKLIEFSKSKTPWISRIYQEFFLFNTFSKKNEIDIWLSLQDISPIVKAKRQVVYFHSPIIFYRFKFIECFLETKNLIRKYLNKHLYRFNIHSNYAVVVQQEWVRSEVINFSKHKNVIVAHPIINDFTKKDNFNKIVVKKNEFKTFIYPTLPRVHKNIEIICKAVEILEKKSINNFEVKITIDGKENKYAKYIFKKYNHLKTIKFIGLQNRSSINDLYASSDAMIFPSKIETWGLPISEAITFNLPIIISDLEYAYESIGSYQNVFYFNHNNDFLLAKIIESFLENKLNYTSLNSLPNKKPFAPNWNALWKQLIIDLDNENIND